MAGSWTEPQNVVGSWNKPEPFGPLAPMVINHKIPEPDATLFSQVRLGQSNLTRTHFHTSISKPCWAPKDLSQAS